ncbi:hypothetical protein Tsubulata_010629 [Turnera subulata]|uniref:Phytocyanin domain-containing protein n=1 Tax=Turnera subulata TaxID=218843 RepID=A0A9Q0FGN2_9ROSI|nr:hypothetical protein Tsubulata_010629 [Turnera subulata]
MTNSMFKLGIAALLLVQCCAQAWQHYVGDENGWVPDFDYTPWVKKQFLLVGDTLVFVPTSVDHNVVEVFDKYHYQNCDGSNGRVWGHNEGVEVTLKTAGVHYFISTINQDCRRGMAIAVQVNPQ